MVKLIACREWVSVMGYDKKVKVRHSLSLQYYLSISVFFLSSLLLLVYLNFHFFFEPGNSQVGHLDELKESMVELAGFDRALNDNVIKVEFNFDDANFDGISYYIKEINRLASTLQSFDGVGVPASAKREIKQYLVSTEQKKQAVAHYKTIMEAYQYSKEAFYIGRKRINQEINDESIKDPHKVQLILDSVQRQVNLFLQYPDSKRKYNSIEFLRTSGNKLKTLAPELASVESFLNEGVSLIENKVNRRLSVEKILFSEDSYLSVKALDFSLENHEKDSNILILLGLIVLFFLTGLLLFQFIRKGSKTYSNVLDVEEYDIEFMEGFRELTGKDNYFDSTSLPRDNAGAKVYKFSSEYGK